MTKWQANRIIGLLVEIRDQQAALVQLLNPIEETPAPVACLHPEEARVNLGSMGEIEWECRAVLADGRKCKYHYGPVSKNAG